MLFIQLAEHCKQATTETTICNCSPNHLYINRGRYVGPTRDGVAHDVAAKPRPCEPAAKPRHVAAKLRAAKPRII